MVTEFIQTYRSTIAGKYDAKRYSGAAKAGEALTGGAKLKD